MWIETAGAILYHRSRKIIPHFFDTFHLFVLINNCGKIFELFTFYIRLKVFFVNLFTLVLLDRCFTKKLRVNLYTSQIHE